MEMNELYLELKSYKNRRIDFYIVDIQKMIKGYLKNTEIGTEEKDMLILSIQDIKSDEDMLKKYTCKSNKDGKKSKKERTRIELKGFSEIRSIEKKVLSDKITFKLGFLQEEFGIIIYNY